MGVEADLAVRPGRDRRIALDEEGVDPVTGGRLDPDRDVSLPLLPDPGEHVVEPRRRLRRGALVSRSDLELGHEPESTPRPGNASNPRHEPTLTAGDCEDVGVDDSEAKPVYALNLFDVADRDEYAAYSRRSAREVARHGGKVLALGKFSGAIRGEIEPRQVLILVEWQSRAHFDAYREDPELADLHSHREAGGGNYVWHLFDKLDDLRPLLK